MNNIYMYSAYEYQSSFGNGLIPVCVQSSIQR